MESSATETCSQKLATFVDEFDCDQEIELQNEVFDVENFRGKFSAEIESFCKPLIESANPGGFSFHVFQAFATSITNDFRDMKLAQVQENEAIRNSDSTKNASETEVDGESKEATSPSVKAEDMEIDTPNIDGYDGKRDTMLVSQVLGAEATATGPTDRTNQNENSDAAQVIERVFTDEKILRSQSTLVNKLTVISDFYVAAILKMSALINEVNNQVVDDKDTKEQNEKKDTTSNSIAKKKPAKSFSNEIFTDLICHLLVILDINTINKYWRYIETRFHVLKSNGLIARGKIISTTNAVLKKLIPGPHDVLIFRIRVAISNFFDISEATGLNKNFRCANREVKFARGSRHSLYRAYSKISEAFLHPYEYLIRENQKDLTLLTQIMFDLIHDIKDADSGYFKENPPIDQFALKTKRNPHQEEQLKSKYSKKEYFTNVSNSVDEYFIKRFHTDYKARQIISVQMYIMVGFFYSMIEDNKKELLDKAKVSSNQDLPISGSIPDKFNNQYFKLKKDIPAIYNSSDSPFAFTLKAIRDQGETNWFHMLLNSKTSISVEPIFDEELSQAKTSNEEFGNFKKRYFNKFATPQLSKKISVQRSLDKLIRKRANTDNDYDKRIGDLSDEITDTLRQEEIDALSTQRNVLHWKNLKKLRTNNWLNFGPISHSEINKDEPFDSKLIVNTTHLKRTTTNDLDQPSTKKQKI